MEYARFLSEFPEAPTLEQIAETLEQIAPRALAARRVEIYKRCFGMLDLTSLGAEDTHARIEELTARVVAFPEKFPGIPPVASVCVYPAFVETVGLAAGSAPVAITSVAGGFPAAQTFLEVKVLEAAMAVENGADEIDVVLSAGRILEQQYEAAGSELEVLREELGEEVILKVILETGSLGRPETIRKAALLAMCAGADFIKTSTGKTPVAATPEAAVVMCQAIRDFYAATGRRVGFKAAGGIATPEQAALYYAIAEHILGEEWLHPGLLRIGASSLANRLLAAITGEEVNYF